MIIFRNFFFVKPKYVLKNVVTIHQNGSFRSIRFFLIVDDWDEVNKIEIEISK